MNSLPMVISTSSNVDGSFATDIANSAMPFHVSMSAIATVPDTVLINPDHTPTEKSV